MSQKQTLAFLAAGPSEGMLNSVLTLPRFHVSAGCYVLRSVSIYVVFSSTVVHLRQQTRLLQFGVILAVDYSLEVFFLQGISEGPEISIETRSV